LRIINHFNPISNRHFKKNVLKRKNITFLCYTTVMDIIISHNSALQYWRLHRNANVDAAARLRRKNLPNSIPNTSAIRSAVPSELSYPINLMVDSQNAKRRTKLVRPRVFSGSVPEWCFVKIEDGVFVCSPQFSFFQMAEELSLIELIKLGLELCGTYSMPVMGVSDRESAGGPDRESAGGPDRESGGESGGVSDREPGGESAEESDREPGGESDGKSDREPGRECLYNQAPLTSVRALKAFTARMKGVKGRKKADRALRYITDGSASPMETIVFMLLTLPYKLGGYRLPKPELNKRIDIHKIAKQRPDRSFYKCDLYWSKTNLAVEYDSDLYHTGPERIERDSIKRLDLKTLGIEVVTATRRQIQSALELENLAKSIAKNLGKRFWYKNPQFQKARKDLHDLLL